MHGATELIRGEIIGRVNGPSRTLAIYARPQLAVAQDTPSAAPVATPLQSSTSAAAPPASAPPLASMPLSSLELGAAWQLGQTEVFSSSK
jgi:hypothetical protein